MLIDGEKWACEACVRGHRVTTCKHHDRSLIRINRKGRPFATCSVCHHTPCPTPDEHTKLRREAEAKSSKITRIPGRRPSSTRSHAAFIPIAPRPAPSSVSSASSSSSLAPESSARGLMLEDLQYSRQAEPRRDVPVAGAGVGVSGNGAAGATSLSPPDTYLPLSCASLGSSPLGPLETPLSVSMSMFMPMSVASGSWTDATPAYADAGPFTLEDMDVDVIGDWTWLSQTV
ncbi:copper-fist-domain-containing protein [Aspergillus steynii IBT 23096]|uniref:Copper-fist-domain-containing protein n=1 Tax=Aspergillus steynii IBT 23096 TaxID=1392250 RepID=A0A2I2FRR7_9EURO|nr:copper-fist-domain-containing protein [Aspergillus steynii IBT 23096]PLB43330.1 copper-fist-domain-containing protein [Aspergillus steynii IBT 23096]